MLFSMKFIYLMVITTGVSSTPAQFPDYSYSFSNILTGNYETNSDEGLVQYFFNKTNIDHIYYHDVNIYSGDRFTDLKRVSDMLSSAINNELWGDVFYLYNYITFNAFKSYLDLTNTSELMMELDIVLRAYGEDYLTVLSNSCSSISLSNYYKQFESNSTIQVSKRDATFCDGNHIPSIDSCNRLADTLGSQAGTQFGGGNAGNYCIDGCCLSWQETDTPKAAFNGEWAQGKVHWCIDQCVSYDKSCLIADVVNDNNFAFDLCVSNRGDGCL